MKVSRYLFLGLISTLSFSACQSKSSEPEIDISKIDPDNIAFTSDDIVQKSFGGLGVEWGAYEDTDKLMDGGWEKTFELLKQGIEEGKIREIDLNIFKLMYEACVDKLLMGDYLKESGTDYPTALAEVVDVMVDGIVTKGR